MASPDPGIGLAELTKPESKSPSKDSPAASIMSMTDIMSQAANRLEGAFDHITKRLDGVDVRLEAHERIFYDLAGGNTERRLLQKRRSSQSARRSSSLSLRGSKSPVGGSKSPVGEGEGSKEGEGEPAVEGAQVASRGGSKDGTPDAVDASAATPVRDGTPVSDNGAPAEDDAYAKWVKMESLQKHHLGDMPEEFSAVFERLAKLEDSLNNRVLSLEMNMGSMKPQDNQSAGNVDWMGDLRAMVDDKLASEVETLQATLKQELIEESMSALEAKVRETLEAIKEEEAQVAEKADHELNEKQKAERAAYRARENAAKALTESLQMELTDMQIKMGELAKLQVKMQEAQDQILVFENQLQGLKGLTESLESQGTDIQSKIDPLQELANHLQTDVGGLSDRIEEVHGKHAEEMKSHAEANAEKHGALEQMMTEKQEEMLEKLQDLEKQVQRRASKAAEEGQSKGEAPSKEETDFLHQRIDDLQNEFRKSKKESMALRSDSKNPAEQFGQELQRLNVELSGSQAKISELMAGKETTMDVLAEVETQLLERVSSMEQRFQLLNNQVSEIHVARSRKTSSSTLDLSEDVDDMQMPALGKGRPGSGRASMKMEKSWDLIKSVSNRVEKISTDQTEVRRQVDMFGRDLEKLSKVMMDKILAKIQPLLRTPADQSTSDWTAVSDNASTGELGLFRIEFDQFKEHFEKENERHKIIHDRIYGIEDQIAPLQDHIERVQAQCTSTENNFPILQKRLTLLEHRTDQETDEVNKLKRQVDILIRSQDVPPKTEPKARRGLASQRQSERKMELNTQSRDLDLTGVPTQSVEAAPDGKTLGRLQTVEEDLKHFSGKLEELRAKMQASLDEIGSNLGKDMLDKQQQVVKALETKVDSYDSNNNLRLHNLEKDVKGLKHDLLKIRDLEGNIMKLDKRVTSEEGKSKNPQDSKAAKEAATRGFLMVEDRLLKTERRLGAIEDYTQKFVRRVTEGTPYDQVQNLTKNAVNTDPGYPAFPKVEEAEAGKEIAQKSDAKVDAAKLGEVKDIALKTQSAVVALQNHVDMIERQGEETKDVTLNSVQSRIDRLEIMFDLHDGPHGSPVLTEAVIREMTGSRTGTNSTQLPAVTDARGQSEEDLMENVDVFAGGPHVNAGHLSGRSSAPLMHQRPSTSQGSTMPHRRSMTPSNRPSTTLDNPVSLGAKMKGLEYHLQNIVLEKALAPVQKLDSKVTEDLDKKGREIMQLARRVAEIDCRISGMGGRSVGSSKRSTARH